MEIDWILVLSLIINTLAVGVYIYITFFAENKKFSRRTEERLDTSRFFVGCIFPYIFLVLWLGAGFATSWGDEIDTSPWTFIYPAITSGLMVAISLFGCYLLMSGKVPTAPR